MFFSFIVFSFLFGKDEGLWSEFGDSPNSLQAHPKFAPNSYVFIFSVSIFLFFLFYFFWKRGMIFCQNMSFQAPEYVICKTGVWTLSGKGPDRSQAFSDPRLFANTRGYAPGE